MNVIGKPITHMLIHCERSPAFVEQLTTAEVLETSMGMGEYGDG
jgi:hypothetical protein